jgi:acetate---CoA ligase (ADP-forming)
MPENPLHLLLHPRSIATAGAGNNPLKMGTLQALSILKDGWQGTFYPVHPTEKTVLGHKAYASPLDLPEAPDLAMLIVPTAQVLPLFEQFARIGTKRVVVVSAGFKETGAEGRRLEGRLNEIAAAAGMRFLGPNCVGFVNTALALNATIAVMDGRPGLLGLASQSGTYVTQTLAYLRDRGIRFSKAVSCGNEANIDITDVMEYLGQDEQTRAILLYIEGIRDGRRFIETAQRITPFKPVLAQYVGGSAAGARAGLSHTGALSGPDDLYDGIFRQAGIIRCRSIEELYAHGWVHATQPPLRGNRLGIVTNSGGPGTAISHNADQGGLTIPAFSEALRKAIGKLIPGHASSANPVDVTFHLDMDLLSAGLPEKILRSGEVDALIIHGAMGTGFMREIHPHIRELIGNPDLEEFLAPFRKDLSDTTALPAKYGLPVVISSFFDSQDNYTQAYRDHAIPVFDSPEKAAGGIVSLLRHREIRGRKPLDRPEIHEANPGASRIIRTALASGQSALDEHQGKQILAAYGVPVTREGLAATETEAARIARRIGFPVAAKACAWEILHKSGKGLIALNIPTQQALRRAFGAIREAAGRPVPVLIQAMLPPGGREFVCGMTRFAGFGPCVLFGLGGIFAEALRDTTVRSAPFGAAEAEEMLLDIRAKDLLGPFRGLPAVDRPALAAILQTVGFIALRHPEIAEIDLNPVIISGSQPVVADALFILKAGDRPAAPPSP